MILQEDAPPVTQRIRPHVGEYHALLLTATLGAVLLASARKMIAFYVALELLSISLYILVGMSKTERRSSEAAFKYLVYGAAASAVLLYGLALLYGLTGRTDLVGVAHGLGSSSAAVALALTLVIAGLTFKLGAVPLHQWVPDVYEGATAPVAGFIATLSKAAGFAILLRVVVTTFPVARSTWLAVIALAAALTTVIASASSTSHAYPACTAASKTNSLAKKPIVGGMPISDTMPTARAAAAIGLRRDRPR